MKPRAVSSLPSVFAALLLLCVCLSPVTASAANRAVSFNLSTSKTFAPGEPPTIQLYTHDVDALEFRVYRIGNPVRFLENLRELHSFGNTEPGSSGERIDERTWLERFHDWKLNLWYSIRSWVRYQFSHEARQQMRDHQSSVSRKSRIVSAAEFAQIPLLNSSQLLARWRQQVPSTYISDSNRLAVPRLDAGLYLLEATDGQFKAYTLISVTPWALITRTRANSVTAFLVDRATGEPVPGVTVDAGFGQHATTSAVTGKDGTADLNVADRPKAEDNFWVVAGKDNNFAITTPGTYSLNEETSNNIVSYFFTERPVYRPGDTAHWKAVLREKRDNLLVVPAARTADVTITDESDKTLQHREMTVTADGTVSGDFDIPKTGALGFYGISIAVGTSTVHGNFHVEEYRKPEYRVSVTSAKKTTLLGSAMPVTIDSRYFFGEPVSNAAVKYRVYRERHYWWGGGDDSDDSENTSTNDDDASSSAGYAGDVEAEKTGRLNADGKLVIQVPTTVDDKGFTHPDFDYTVEAGVTDAANREITGRGRFLGTYSTFHINVENINYGVRVGEAARFRVKAVDYDNKPVSTRIHVQLAYRHYVNGKTEMINGDSIDLQTDTIGSAEGSLPVKQSNYSSAALLASAKAVVPGTRDVTDEGYVWVMGANESGEGYRETSQTARIMADKRTYAPGDTAHLSLQSEVAGFHALVIVNGNSLIKREVMTTSGKSLSFDLPITAASQPNLSVEALFLRDGVLYQASKTLNVPPTQQQLQVSITPVKDVFQPAESASYDVLTRDAAGNPVRADLSFGVVDEAIYSLYPDSSGDMVTRLYPKRYTFSQVDNSLTYYFSGEAGTKSPMMAMRHTRYRPQLAQVKPGNEAKPRVRKAFPDTAFWAPDVHTDASGHASVTLTFPDSLTTWRATVHAVTATAQAGSAISRVLVRKNVLVRMGTPRFLRKGDELVLPVIVHNYLDSAKQANLSLNVTGLDVVARANTSATVNSKGEGTANWRLRASQIGTAKLTASATTDAESDALELPVPVLPAGVARTLAQSGIVQANASAASANFTFPANTDALAHSLHVEAAPSIAGSLFSALDYLTSFPYGCTEQTMSSFLPNVIVQQTLQRLGVNSRVDADALRARTSAGLERLKQYQHDDGGWGWWKEDASRVYMTAYVVGGIGQAGEAVTKGSPEYVAMLQRGREYLRQQLHAHPNMRVELRAAVLYALAQGRSDRNDVEFAKALEAQWSRKSDLDAESLALTGLAMLQLHDDRAGALAKLLIAKAQQQGELVHWTGNYVPLLDFTYSNDAEATAFALRLLSRTDPASPLLSGTAQWLMLARNGGVYWESTEQTAMVVFGLTEYLASTKEMQSDFTAQVLVNGAVAGQRHFSSADILSGASLSIDVDAMHLQPGSNTVQIRRQDGSGRIYWSTSPKFYSTDKADYQQGKMALNLTRDYFRLQPVQKDGKVVYSMQPISNSTVNIGDVLAVHEAISGSPMRYVMLEDPIAAGTEFVSNTDAYPIDGRPNTWYEWYTRRELRDDRAVFFVTEFGGRQEVFYLVKVVNPGSFHVSPARVEPLYQHGVQATTDQLLLTVPAPAGGTQ